METLLDAHVRRQTPDESNEGEGWLIAEVRRRTADVDRWLQVVAGENATATAAMMEMAVSGGMDCEGRSSQGWPLGLVAT
jgi:hypothetical protein